MERPMAARKAKTRTSNSTDNVAMADAADERVAGEQFVGQWNRLVSTTNWEKGRIICQWRTELEAANADATAYTDEAWAELVGGVTSQHVGRLRRTYQRFGATFDQYAGLFWSHFHAALDWDDAEMWLEGAIQNDWSISQMRGKRWETLGKSGSAPAVDEAATASGDLEIDSEASADEAEVSMSAPAPVKAAGTTAAPAAEVDADDEMDEAQSHEGDDDADDAPTARPAKTNPRATVAVDDLPDDLADAFEQFKLAIIGHRRGGWRETSPEAVIECLEALRDLTLAAE